MEIEFIPKEQKRKTKCFKISVVVISILYFIFYVSVGSFIVKNYYTEPNNIKNKQTEHICHVRNITFEYVYDIINNVNVIPVYKIKQAYGSVNISNEVQVNMTHLFKNIECYNCLKEFYTSCFVYIENDNHKTLVLNKNKNDIEAKFNKRYYIEFFILGLFGFIFIALAAVNFACDMH